MGARIKVLHIIKTLGLGGAETNLLNLARAFDPALIETHVAYSFGGEIEPRFRESGMRLFKYANGSHRIKSPHTPLIILRLARYIRKHRIDIVQTHNFNSHIWGLVAARLGGGAKVIEHVHDFRYVPADELARRHGLLDQYRFIKYFRHRSHRIVVLTDQNADYVVRHDYAAPEQVLKIPNGIALDDALPPASDARSRFGIDPEAVVILTSARIDPSKNIELIVRIAKAVGERAPRAVFLVAGSGTHLGEYQAKSEALGVQDRVRFIGFHQDMDELLAIADVFLLPSFLELHSIAILEAQKMRLPIVISRGVGCNDEFVEDGVNGFLCDPFDDARWIEVLARLCNDASLRQLVGEAGYRTCSAMFGLPETAARFQEIYTNLSLKRTRVAPD